MQINKASGFSLLEFTLASAIASMLLLLFFNIFDDSKKINKKTDNFAEVTEDINFVNNFLHKDVASAGFAGCGSLKDLGTIPKGAQVNFDYSLNSSLRGCDSAHAPPSIANKILYGTDCLIVQKADTKFSTLTKDLKQNMQYAEVTNNPTTPSNKQVLIADCEVAELLAVKNFTGNRLMFYSPTKNAYSTKSSIITSFSETIFFISDTSRVDAKHKKIYGLYMAIDGGNKQELIDNVDDMKILYGIANKNGQVDEYYSYEQITNDSMWADVKSVDLRLHFTNAPKSAQDIDFYVALQER